MGTTCTVRRERAQRSVCEELVTDCGRTVYWERRQVQHLRLACDGIDLYCEVIALDLNNIRINLIANSHKLITNCLMFDKLIV
jgi:hypothetical protein